MRERADMIEWLRGEIVGPGKRLSEPEIATFEKKVFHDSNPTRRGPIAWRPHTDEDLEEILYFDRESPQRKYGVGRLHPIVEEQATIVNIGSPDEAALHAMDTVGVEMIADESDSIKETGDVDDRLANAENTDELDEFEVTGADVRHPSTMGITFCARLEIDGKVIIRLPQKRHFEWQEPDSPAFLVNGRYEACKRRWTDEQGRKRDGDMWRRHPAVPSACEVVFTTSELEHGKVVRCPVSLSQDSPLRLTIELFPRYREIDESWLLTAVLRNSTVLSADHGANERALYQTYFEVSVDDGEIRHYPESQRPFDQLDEEEQSLALLYRESATWGIGHGCACGWEAEPGQNPTLIFADIMPAVELPSMTPVIYANGTELNLSMRALANLTDDGTGPAWKSLDDLASEYASWIERKQLEISEAGGDKFKEVACRHLQACTQSHERIARGIALLRQDERVRSAFRLANLAMLLQQISTKQLDRRPFYWDDMRRLIRPQGPYQSPWDIYVSGDESIDLGKWRAFQIAFLLMSLDGVQNALSPDREIVDLIWFPTGGGKTEAYLGVMAFYMFHERLLMSNGDDNVLHDGTNVLMRYTLRMLTTQQFQRAASLISSMEYLRRNCASHGVVAEIPGQRFSLGLWVGGDGSPNRISTARTEVNRYRKGEIQGNPLILTECPWCRSGIGRFNGAKPRNINHQQWHDIRVKGIDEVDREPLLHCTDSECCFGHEDPRDWLPVEVIDERIYRLPPSLVIGTADKLAIVAYRPQAGSLFGKRESGGGEPQHVFPPGLIVQDELHLISGPLGTMYALYEGVFERLCSFQRDEHLVKPKLIASTATIRGAAEQVRSLYARSKTSLFPAPGLTMSDSFFGTYARDDSGNLRRGRLYLGIHASDYGSALTTQVRSFAAALFRPFSMEIDRRDPWWTLLVFYNSLRELGGAKTLFDSDIRSRLKYMFNREGFSPNVRRTIRIVEELTSRLSQAEIVGMMDHLSAAYSDSNNSSGIDACLASNIIEVGVDIDRLSILGVVGQPKTTATYIQVTGRVGRRWWERPGLILTLYNPGKSRDRSHFEQFHSYHRKLYERVEPTSATPFALSAIQRALPGALITWARQQSDESVQNSAAYAGAIDEALLFLKDRCEEVQNPEDLQRSLDEMGRVHHEVARKWCQNPQMWEEFPQAVDGEYLMLWPGQFSTIAQRQRGVVVPSSMRQVDGSAELRIDQGYSTQITDD